MLIKNPKFEISAVSPKQYPDNDLPQIVLVGKSNVGKSSFINTMVNRKKLARTSSEPGKTRQINFYNMDNNFYFVDLPGYGYAKVSFSEKKRWSDLVEGYFDSSKNISLVVQIIDVRHSPSVLDFQMMDYLYDRKFPFVIVASKVDKLNKTQRTEREKSLIEELSKYVDVPVIIFSSVTGEGIEKIKNMISDCIKS